MKTILIRNLPDDLISYKKKREREVFYSKKINSFVKIWVENWSQSNITKYCIDSKFYNKNITNSLEYLIIDEKGNQRGYIQKKGISFKSLNWNDWNDFNSKVNKKQKLNFFYNILKNSLISKGAFVDLCPSNIILYNNEINLIDLDSFRSFSLIFNKKKEWYENFDLNAWWKPYETANRDFKRFYKEYLSQCLNLEIKYELDSEEKIKDILKVIEIEYRKL